MKKYQLRALAGASLQSAMLRAMVGMTVLGGAGLFACGDGRGGDVGPVSSEEDVGKTASAFSWSGCIENGGTLECRAIEGWSHFLPATSFMPASPWLATEQGVYDWFGANCIPAYGAGCGIQRSPSAHPGPGSKALRR